MSPFLAELIGTMMLVLLGDGVVANVVLPRTKGHASGWIVITTGWALAVTVAVYSVGRVSGAHLNPAVTLSLAALGSFAWDKVPGYLAAQMLGGFLGACLVWLMHYDHWHEADPGDQLAVFCTGPAIPNRPINFVCELVGTALLLFGVLSIGANANSIKGGVDLAAAFSTALNPLLVGALVWSIGLSLGGTTGYAINPARDLGPRLAHALLPIPGKGDSQWSYAWIPVVAPIVGGMLGAGAFRLIGA